MSESIDVTAAPPLAAWRYRLQDRRLWLLVGTIVVAVGLWTGWGWLASIGATGLLVSLLPCVAMCALGFCMRGGSCRKTADGSTAASADASVHR